MVVKILQAGMKAVKGKEGQQMDGKQNPSHPVLWRYQKKMKYLLFLKMIFFPLLTWQMDVQQSYLQTKVIKMNQLT